MPHGPEPATTGSLIMLDPEMNKEYGAACKDEY